MGERERAHLVVQPARFFYIYNIIRVSVRHTTVYLFHRSATGKRKAGSLQVQKSPIRGSQFYARLRFSATRDTTSSTGNHCPSALQRLLNGTPYGYLRVRHRPALCVSLPMNASCCASVLPSTHDYAYCITEHTTHQLQPVGSLPLAQKCLALHYLFIRPHTRGNCGWVEHARACVFW